MKKSAILKLFSLVTFAAAGAFAIANVKSVKKAESVSAGTRTLYCRCAQSWWKADGAAVGAHYWGGTDGTSWPGVRMTAVSGETDLWSIEISDAHTGIIFTRVNGSGTVADWGAKTDDLTIPTDGKNCFTITQSTGAWDGAKSAGEWGTYTPPVVTHSVYQCEVVDGVLNSTPFSTDTVGDGVSYAVPANRYKAGYEFGGWFSNQGCTTPYSVTSITGDTTIYAKYTTHAAWAGTIHVDFRETYWSEAVANYAVMFMNKSYSPEVDGWSTYLTGTTAGKCLAEIPYSLPFEPEQMLIVRYDAAYTVESWNSDKKLDVGTNWGMTVDLTFNEFVRIGTTMEGGKHLAYLGAPKVMLWNPNTSVDLSHVKLNGSNHAEYYSTSVTLSVNQRFKVQVAPYADGDYYATYSKHDSIKDNFSGGGSDDITCLVDGTYAFYFDSHEGSLYITKVEIAEADEWALTFLSEVACSGGNTPSITKDGWSTVAGTYGSLSPEAKDIFTGITLHGKQDGTSAEQAVARYDYIIEKYGESAHNDFMGRKTAQGLVPGSLAGSPNVNYTNQDSNNLIVIVSIVSLISASTLVGLIVIKRRKGIAK